MSSGDFLRELSALVCEKEVAAWAARYVLPAFDGDVDAARSLAIALPNTERGQLAVAMWRAKVPRDAFRTFLEAVWDHDHAHLIAAAGTSRTLAYLFRYAKFPLPDKLPSALNVWRGTSGITMAEALRGYSWTADRDVACWFAMRRADTNGKPLLLTASIQTSEIALFHGARGESEAVLLKAPRGARIDGTPEDWAAGHDRHSAAIQEHNSRV